MSMSRRSFLKGLTAVPVAAVAIPSLSGNFNVPTLPSANDAPLTNNNTDMQQSPVFERVNDPDNPYSCTKEMVGLGSR